MDNFSPLDKYAIVLRVIQPARIQDIIDFYPKIWGGRLTNAQRQKLLEIHEKIRRSEFVVSIRRGTYTLSERGMALTKGAIKERKIDNARLFLMKEQRRKYT